MPLNERNTTINGKVVVFATMKTMIDCCFEARASSLLSKLVCWTQPSTLRSHIDSESKLVTSVSRKLSHRPVERLNRLFGNSAIGLLARDFSRATVLAWVSMQPSWRRNFSRLLRRPRSHTTETCMGHMGGCMYQVQYCPEGPVHGSSMKAIGSLGCNYG